MATYTVNAPNGKTYEVEGPSGASEEDVRAQVLAQHPDAGEVPTTVAEVRVEGKRKPKWSDLPSNIPRSATQFAKNLVDPLLHPVQTAKGVSDLAGGVLQSFRDLSPREMQGSAPRLDRGVSDAAKQALIARYGSPAAVKRTIIEDPVGFVSDASLVVGAPGSVLSKVGGTAGRVGRVMETASKTIDPLAATGRVAKALPRGAGALAAPLLGFTSTTSPAIVRTAYETGVKGGKSAKAFTGQMRGSAPIENLIDEARAGVDKIRADRQAKYLEEMNVAKGQGAASATPIDFAPIQQAVADVKNRGEFKGKRIDPSADSAWGKIDAFVDDWANSDPAEYHSVEGVDALKKGISNIEQGLEINSPARNAAKQVRVAITGEIAKQAPAYAKAMESYETASNLLEDLDKSLAVGKKAAINTTLRKLMTILKDDSSSGFGRNAKLGQVLEDNGAHDLKAMLAGRAMEPALPLGLRGTMSGLGALTYAGSTGVPWLGAPALAASSPRLVGEFAHGIGTLSRPAVATTKAVEGAYNAVRPAPLVAAQSQNYLPEPKESDDLNALLSKYLGVDIGKPKGKEPVTDESAAEEPQASLSPAYDVPWMAKIIAGHEGTGDNPTSSALGRFQFLKGTLASMYNKEHPDQEPITGDQAAAMRADGRISAEDLGRYGIKFTEDNVQRVLDAKAPVTVGNVYLMHFAGEGDGPKVLAALAKDPTTPVKGLISDESIARNSNINYNGKYFKDFTVQDFSDWAEDSMGASYNKLLESGELEG